MLYETELLLQNYRREKEVSSLKNGNMSSHNSSTFQLQNHRNNEKNIKICFKTSLPLKNILGANFCKVERTENGLHASQDWLVCGKLSHLWVEAKALWQGPRTIAQGGKNEQRHWPGVKSHPVSVPMGQEPWTTNIRPCYSGIQRARWRPCKLLFTERWSQGWDTHTHTHRKRLSKMSFRIKILKHILYEVTSKFIIPMEMKIRIIIILR